MDEELARFQGSRAPYGITFSKRNFFLLQKKFADRKPINKINLLPDGYFEDLMEEAKIGGMKEDEGWGGKPGMLFLFLKK